jgi:uncharacterized protein (DUF1330 family)
MSAYVLVDIEVHDPVEYEEYKRLAGPTVGLYGGRYIVRGGATEVLEGDRVPHRTVVLEFPTADDARRWWNSAEYAPAKVLRQRAATTDMILVEGI